MTDTALHLIVSHAATPDEARRQTLAGLRLPRLTHLLSRLSPLSASDTAAAGDRRLNLPHEHALARALGLPGQDGHLPWAAWQQARAGQPPDGRPLARLTPCHWAVGSDHIALRDPEALNLSDEDSQALLAAMQPYFAEDGLTVQWQSALRWTACGELLRDLPCASLEQVIGRRVDDWLPRTPAARPVRRLQQEMQMLLYTHPVNEARDQRGLLPVNSFWVDGAGALPVGWTVQGEAEVYLDERLRGPALQGDASAWGLAWQRLDAEALPPLLQALDAGRAVCLTLAGERAAATFGARASGSQRLPRAIGNWLGRVGAPWLGPRPARILDTL